jgi:WD40-like Beta Propeller Repeat
MAEPRSPLRALCAAGMLGLLGLVAPATSQAAAYDPDLTWRTLQTEHFNITFHGGEEQLANEMAASAEAAYDTLTEELRTELDRRVEVVLVDITDSANGYAMTLPVNTIVIYVTAPEEDSTLSMYEDWSHAIMVHELTHILHIDMVEGAPLAVRAIFGRIISVNRMSPAWIIEGQATFQETRHTTGGRGRSTVPDMIKRMSVLEDQFPPLGNLDGFQAAPPSGNLRYLYGQDFQQFIADQQGDQVWTDWMHTYGGWVPYLLPSKRVFGKRLPALYRDWKASLETKYEAVRAQVEAQGLTAFELLSDDVSRCAGPTWSPDGAKVLWSCTNPATGSDILVADAQRGGPETWLPAAEGTSRWTSKVTVAGKAARDFSWRPDSKAFVYSSSHVVNTFNSWNDVYFKHLDGTDETITRGKRARHPAFSPDGRELLVVTNAAQNNQLERLTVDRKLEPLTNNTDHTQLSTPAWSPDGRHLAISQWRGGQRDIWILDADGQPLRQVTEDLAHDVDPIWSPDGRSLYFSSDRSGIFNLYAVDLDTERLWQVTNVLGGAFHPAPSPDGTSLLFESFSHNGTDVAWMALDRGTWKDRGVLSLPLLVRAPLAPMISAVAATAAPPDVVAPDSSKPVAPLSPWGEPVPGPTPMVADERSSGRGVPTALLDAQELPGMTGLGGPFQTLAHLPGPWGLPGQARTAGLGDAPDAGVDADDPTKVEEAIPEEQEYSFDWPVERYAPLPSLLPPRYLSPSLYSTTFGFMGVLSTGGVDTLRRYAYSAYASYRTDSNFVGWGGSVAYNRFLPVITAGAYAYTTPYSDVYEVTTAPPEGGAWIPSVQSRNERYWDKRIRSYAQVSWPLDETKSVFARWTGSLHSPLDEIDADVYRSLLPTRGFLSSVGGGWRYAKGKSYELSISPEDARVISLVGEVYSPLLGAYILDDTDQRVSFQQVRLTAEWREYQTVPFFANHVLAIKLAGGSTLGDGQRYGSFRLGGSFGESGYYTLPEEWRALRGFAPASVYGDNFYLGSAEYRLPIFRLDRGVSTIPAFGRTLSAAAFVDAGNATDELNADAIIGTRVGTGAELRGSAVLGWGVGVSARVGYAFAVRGDDGIPFGSTDGFYAWLGSSF